MHAFTRDRASGRAEIEITPMSSHGARGITCAEGHSAPSSRGRELKLLSRWPFGQKARQLVKRLLVKKVTLWAENGGLRPRRGRRWRGGHGGRPRANLQILSCHFVRMGAGSTAAHSDRPSADVAKTRSLLHLVALQTHSRSGGGYHVCWRISRPRTAGQVEPRYFEHTALSTCAGLQFVEA